MNDTVNDAANDTENDSLSEYKPGPAVEEAQAQGDYTSMQYAYGSGAGGMDVPDWNDMTKRNVSGNIVVAVMDTGVDYDHEDLKEVMWDDGIDYPELTSLG